MYYVDPKYMIPETLNFLGIYFSLFGVSFQWRMASGEGSYSVISCW